MWTAYKCPKLNMPGTECILFLPKPPPPLPMFLISTPNSNAYSFIALYLLHPIPYARNSFLHVNYREKFSYKQLTHLSLPL